MSNTGTFANPHSLGIARFVSGLHYDAIPREVIARVKLLILDTLGCGIHAAAKEHSRILAQTLQRVDASRDCTIWGTSQRLSAPHAALLNGAMVQGFEIDDVHMRATIHVGSVSLPAALALAELVPPVDGRRLLTAAVAAYEVGPRVGLCMGNAHLAQGWHAPATQGVFAAAAASAACLGLTTAQTVHALGIAGTQSSGLMAAQYGAMVKRMNAGRAAQSGLYAALLAQSGFTGIENVFESEYGGFCTTFSRSQDEFDLAQLTAGLGGRFETMNVSLKFYSCAASIHTTLDALRHLQAQRPFSGDDVDEIEVRMAKLTMDHVGFDYQPAGMTAAQMNLKFCVATLLLEGDVFVDQFSERSFTDPVRIALAAKVRVVHDPEITALGPQRRLLVKVTVRLKDRSLLQGSAETARGRESCFASETEVIGKFKKLSTATLPADAADQLVGMVMSLESLPDVAALARLLIGR